MKATFSSGYVKSKAKYNKFLFCGKSTIPELQLDRLAKLVTILTRTSLCGGDTGQLAQI